MLECPSEYISRGRELGDFPRHDPAGVEEGSSCAVAKVWDTRKVPP